MVRDLDTAIVDTVGILETTDTGIYDLEQGIEDTVSQGLLDTSALHSPISSSTVSSYSPPSVVDTHRINATSQRNVKSSFAGKTLPSRTLALTKNLFLVSSGLFLGVFIAMGSTYRSEPLANAATFHVEKVVSLPREESPTVISEETKAEGKLVISDRLRELEEWFQQQPVPVKERVFLHRAESHLKSHTVGYQQPERVRKHSEGESAPLAVAEQGDFRLNDPKGNASKATAYQGETLKKYNLSPEVAFEVKASDSSLSTLTSARQTGFGPQIK